MPSMGIDSNVGRLAELLEQIPALESRRDDTPPSDERDALGDWIAELRAEELVLTTGGQSSFVLKLTPSGVVPGY